MKARRRRLLLSVALSLGLACGVTIRAGAEVQLSGTQDNVVLRANNATMAEILSGMSSTFNLRIELTGTPVRQFTGAYTGSLRRVLSRLLDGEDYIINSTAGGMEIILLGPKSAGQSARRTAGNQEPVNPVQGWSPDANTVAKTAPKEPAPRADSGRPVRLAADNDEESHAVQGWTGSPDLSAKPLSPVKPGQAPQANATPQTADTVKPQPDAPEEGSGVQGWVPAAAQDPFKDIGAKLAPIDAAAAAASADADQGNANFQGYMPDWMSPEPGKSVLESMPMPPGATIGMPRQ
jgi:hypothetical protein